MKRCIGDKRAMIWWRGTSDLWFGLGDELEAPFHGLDETRNGGERAKRKTEIEEGKEENKKLKENKW